jgi:hypothetical protein
MSLIEKLKAGKKNTKVIKYPGTDEDVCMQILSNEDLQAAAFATEHHFKQAGIEVNQVTMDSYDDERTTQILFRVLREPADPKKGIAATVDELRRHITQEEKEVLVREFSEFRQECSPDFRGMSNEEFETLWKDLKKNPETLLSFSSSTMLKGLLLYLASRPAN